MCNRLLNGQKFCLDQPGMLSLYGIDLLMLLDVFVLFHAIDYNFYFYVYFALMQVDQCFFPS